VKKQILKNDWAPLLEEEFEKPYYLKLRAFLKKEYMTRTIYPNMYDIFNALHYTPFSKVKAVILGQDPYHGPNQAHGLSFSVKPGVEPPPSLKNIFAELHNDLGCPIPDHGCLIPWAEQGVLLLNTVLTVREGRPIPTGAWDGRSLPTGSSKFSTKGKSRSCTFCGGAPPKAKFR